jgi:hypothetical protein
MRHSGLRVGRCGLVHVLTAPGCEGASPIAQPRPVASGAVRAARSMMSCGTCVP